VKSTRNLYAGRIEKKAKQHQSETVMPRQISAWMTVLVMVSVMGCAHRPVAAPTQPSAPSTMQQAPAGGASAAQGQNARRSIADTVKGSRKSEGLFTVYQDTTNGSLHLIVTEDQLEREFIYFTHVVEGVVPAGFFRGAFGTNNVFSVRRHFNRIEFVGQNTGFFFDPANAVSRAADANISPAVIAVQEIVAHDAETGHYLIKADDLFLTEAFTQVKPTPNPNARPGQMFTLGNLSRAKSRVLEVRNYPANTDVIVDYVYDNPAPLNRGGAEVTDPRYVSVRVQHSLIEMPENDFVPRRDDARVGYFTQRVDDLTSAEAANWRDVINRWHLVKQDPSAALSEPVEPIVWWIENTTPVEYRDAIRDATLAWNSAFEAAGFRNAVRVEIQPDDADWDAGDIRYNVLRWTSSPTPPFGGYGPSFVNPRTGQILGADIMLEFVFLTNRMRQERVFDVAALHMDTLAHSADDHRFCSLGHHLHHSTLVGLHALRVAGATEQEVSEYVNQALFYLISHEVGHTLGLNHNMRASQMLSPDEAHDKSITRRLGLAGSVMDYPAVNLAAPGMPQGDYFTAAIGPYDIWAIEFGYSPALPDAQAEGARLSRILARSTDPALAFGNDADDMRAPGKAIDPRVNINDMSSDPITFSIRRFDTVAHLMKGIQERYTVEGRSYHDLRGAYLTLTGEHAMAANTISRFIGGVYVDRAVAGQEGATRPFTPVSLADQKRAMQALSRYVFAPNAFDAPEGLINYLQMQRRGFDFFQDAEDPRIHNRVLNIQRGVIAHLVHPSTLQRLTDSRLYGNQYDVATMMRELTDAVFQADARTNVNTFRQNLQIEYVNGLIGMVDGQAAARYDHIARSAALQNLQRVRQTLRGKSGVNAETAAHTAHVLFLVDKALETR
jgi:hypothetical protein